MKPKQAFCKLVAAMALISLALFCVAQQPTGRRRTEKQREFEKPLQSEHSGNSRIALLCLHPVLFFYFQTYPPRQQPTKICNINRSEKEEVTVFLAWGLGFRI
jgi:hypothetical protein